MKILCWLFGHKRKLVPCDDFGLVYLDRCERGCKGHWRPSLPDKLRFWTSKDYWRWFREAHPWPCWLLGHAWDNYYDCCPRCGLDGVDLADVVGDMTIPARFKRLVRVTRFKEVREWDNDTMTVQRVAYLHIGKWRFGWERSPITFNGAPYMTRYILWLGPINLRLHQFFRGDDDTASHTHPWWFITIPFAPYRESVFDHGKYKGDRLVWPFIPHFRGRGFEHIVIGRIKYDWKFKDWMLARLPNRKPMPFWTFVIAGTTSSAWGFYSFDGSYTPWQNFKPGKRT